MLGNALEEVGCHLIFKALQEKIPGVVWRVPYSGDYGYSGVLKSVWDGSYNYKILLTRMSMCKNSPAL